MKRIFFALTAFFILSAPLFASESSAPTTTDFEQLRSMVVSLQEEVRTLREENEFCKMRLKSVNLCTEEELRELTRKAKLRPALEKRLETLEGSMGDIQIAVQATGVVEGTLKNPEGSNQQYAVGDLDFYFQAPIADNTIALVKLEAVGGDGPDATLNSLSGLNCNAGSLQSADGVDRINVSQVWIETEFEDIPFGEELVATIGKVDMTSFFDANEVANDEHTQFLATSLVNNSAVEFPGNSPGGRIAWDAGYGLTLQIGAASWDDSGQQLFNQVFGIGEIDYSTDLFFGLPGNYRFYYYVGDPRNDTDPDGDGILEDAKGHTSWGFGFSIDQKVHEKITLFGRFGRNDDHMVKRGYDSPNHNKYAWSIGGQLDDPLSLLDVPGHEQDILAFGFSQIIPYQRDRTFYPNVGFTQQVRPSWESLWEIYYACQFKRDVQISPFIQVAKNTGSYTDYHASNEAVLYGVRSYIEF